MDLDSAIEAIVAERHGDCNRIEGNKKIFMPTIGTLGDVMPFLILAKELQKRGHIVCMGVHQRFQDMVKAAGKYGSDVKEYSFSLNFMRLQPKRKIFKDLKLSYFEQYRI